MKIRSRRSGTVVTLLAVVACVGLAAVTVTRRVEATTFTVLNLNDSGAGSLRQAILDANANAGPDTINFQAGLTGTITLTTGQLTIDDPTGGTLTITGPGANLLTVSAQMGTTTFRVFDISGNTTVSISGLTMADGNVTGVPGPDDHGGNIRITGATVTLTNCAVLNGRAAQGGGIEVNPGNLTLVGCTVAGNISTVSTGGGLIVFAPAIVSITNSTFSGNLTATTGGAFIFVNPAVIATISSSTVTANTASNGAGGIFNLSDSLTIKNTIIAGNSGTIPDVNRFTSAGSNLIGNNTGTTISNQMPSDLVGTGMTPIDPMLGPLADNGGPTRTHALLEGSVAIDAVTDCTDQAIPPVAVTTDQRGEPRPFDGDGNGSLLCDAGAFELQICLLTCPANITMSNDANQCGAVVNFQPTIVGPCGTVTCSPSSGSFFPVGTTTVTCGDGQTSCSFTVTVNDTQPPTISCPPNITLTGDPSGMTPVTYPPPTVSDNCQPTEDEKGRPSGVEPPNTIVCTPASGSSFAFGTTTVTCTYSDGAGNSASCSFTVTVNPPCQIICPANQTASNDPNQCGAVVNYPAATTTGVCSTGVTCSPPSGSFFAVGTTSVTCSADDENGRPVSCSFTVTVNDTQPPTITCPAAVTAVAPPACPPSATTVATFPPPVATDNCPGVTVACVPPSGSPLPVGTTTVTCTATDAAGNTATCSFSVTVFNACIQDDSNPANVILFNTQTGEYRACCGGMVYTGTGTVTRQGCDVTLQHNAATWRMTAKWSSAYWRGSGAVQSPVGTTRCTITDRDIRNNSCLCGAATK